MKWQPSMLVLLVLAALVHVSAAWAECGRFQRWDYCYDVENLDDIVIIPTEADLFGSTTGNIEIEEEFCARSFWRDFRTGEQSLAYETAVRGVEQTPAVGFLGPGWYRVRNRSGNNNSFFIQLLWDRAIGSNNFSPVVNRNTETGQGVEDCASSTDNSAFKVIVPRSEIRRVLPGRYEGRFRIDIGAEDIGGVDYGFSEQVRFNITLPTLVKISALDNMTLAQRNSADTGYEQEEPFCVFVWGGGDYQISASGGPGVNDPFQLSLAGNPATTVPYGVRFSETGNTNFRPLPATAGGNNQLDCGGVDNARVQVQLQDSDVANKPAGVYRGTLYLTVEAA